MAEPKANVRSRQNRRAKHLTRGRESFGRRDWRTAREALLRADAQEPLEAADLEKLGDAAYLCGDDALFFACWERAHRQHLETGEPRRAALCAFWSGLHGMFRGEVAKASGWFARAGRLLQDQAPCVHQGYLLLPRVHQEIAAARAGVAAGIAAEARRIGAQHADPELVAIATHLEGRARIAEGRVAEGLSLLDETMLAVTGDELSPRVTGLLYCSVIEGCQQVHAIERAAEWTEALRAWCDAQPGLLAFTGKCLIHRAEILQLSGAWQEAIEAARSACERIACGPAGDSAGPAHYQEGEVRRLRGELSAAEEAYQRASALGTDPQPGLALLRLAQGERRAAAASIRRALDGAQGPIARSALLPACVEIMLANGEPDAARSAVEALHDTARTLASPLLRAHAMLCEGSVRLAEGAPRAALRELGGALPLWERMRVPYALARTQWRIAQACEAVGDADGRRSYLAAARAGFERLGASLELANTTVHGERDRAPDPHRLSPRELEVLRLVARGHTNREIAASLSLSVKTIDRHVSNLLTKLDVSSRAAATAYAYENELL